MHKCLGVLADRGLGHECTNTDVVCCPLLPLVEGVLVHSSYHYYIPQLDPGPPGRRGCCYSRPVQGPAGQGHTGMLFWLVTK